MMNIHLICNFEERAPEKDCLPHGLETSQPAHVDNGTDGLFSIVCNSQVEWRTTLQNIYNEKG
jgi:hypothetical protein